MTLQQLEYIIALDTHRHFVKAAEHCFVTQPTLTMQVKKLEDEIGIQLFDRSKKPLKPTPAGEQIIAKIRQIHREVNQLKAYVSDEKESLTGTFNVGIIPTLAPYVLPLFIQEFNAQYPEAHLIVRELQSHQIVEQLQQDQLDIGIAVSPFNHKSLREVTLFHEPFLFYGKTENLTAVDGPIDVDDIPVENLLLLEEGHCFRNQMLQLCQQQKKASSKAFTYESGSIETLKNLVLQGAGTTLVPELAVQHELNTPHVRRFKQPEPAREVSLIVHKGFTKENLLDALRSSILNHIPEHFQKNEHFIRVKWR